MQVRNARLLVGLVTGLVLLSGGVGGCSSTTGADSHEVDESADNLSVRGVEGLLILTQNIVPSAAMDALFEGVVSAGDAGCLRIESKAGYGVTVVWPAGYSIAAEQSSPRILDASGGTVGVLGGAFHLAGGEVAELPASLGFTDADRALAAARCPGRYWIVAGS